MSELPEGDVLIHAGDCTGAGHLFEIDDFTQWFGSQPHKHKVLVAGNHDYSFQKLHPASTWAREMCEKNGISYLQDQAVVIEGVKFFGSPWTPVYRDMAFNSTEAEMAQHRALIPDDVEVLITHGPPWRIFDYVPRDAEHVGCYPLFQRIEQLKKLKAHVFGHIHEGYGFAQRESDGLKFANASTCTARYKPTNPPIIIDL
jgi:predicted phosphohydrolase